MRKRKIIQRMKKSAGGSLLLLVISLCLWGCTPKNQEIVWLEEETGDTVLLQEEQSETGQGKEAQERELTEPLKQEISEEETTLQEAETVPKELYVHVCGAVKSPGVYMLPEGSRIVDAVTAAGGMQEAASEEALNQALLLTDGMQLYVPTREEAGQEQEWIHTTEAAGQAQNSTTGAAEKGTSASGKVNINTADLAQLCTLPGIGESRAASIVAYREEQGSFSVIEDIMKVSGIKDAAFAKIKDKICVQ